MKTKTLTLSVALLTLLVSFHRAVAQGTVFTYQGRLDDGGMPGGGSYDLRFTLYTADVGGSQVGPTLTNAPVTVSNGLFTTMLDFGTNVFTGPARWLELAVRTNGGGAFTLLNPRQPLTPSPYAIYAGKAMLLDSALPASQLSGSYSNALTLNNPANAFTGGFTGNGSGLSALNASALASGAVPAAALSNAWKIAGNAGTTPGTHFLGTADDQPLEIKVNNTRGWRLEPGTNGVPNLVGGAPDNGVGAGTTGATIAGGASNTIGTNSPNGVIGGGSVNAIAADTTSAAIAGGAHHDIGTNADFSAIGGGYDNNIASNAEYAVIPGGRENAAAGDYALAAGRRAKANHAGSFVWADSTDADFRTATNNQFLIRATFVGINRTNRLTPNDVFSLRAPQTNDYGGMYVETVGATGKPFYGYALAGLGVAWHYVDSSDAAKWKLNVGSSDRITVTTNGNVGIGLNSPTNKLHVLGGVSATAFVNTSDRNAKENFAPVSPREVLQKLATVPISKWNFKEMPGLTHMGPTAQDFYAAFGLGGSDTTITTVDHDGVALAAIQGLNQKLNEQIRAKDKEIESLTAAVVELRDAMVHLSRRLEDRNPSHSTPHECIFAALATTTGSSKHLFRVRRRGHSRPLDSVRPGLAGRLRPAFSRRVRRRPDGYPFRRIRGRISGHMDGGQFGQRADLAGR